MMYCATLKSFAATCVKFLSQQSTSIAAFLIGTEEKDLACRNVRTCFELHFYISADEERGIMPCVLTHQKSRNRCFPESMLTLSTVTVPKISLRRELILSSTASSMFS